ncbi:hypothetical protein BH11PSE11_BH11PSE11_08990 [soil metagenome]
MKKITQPVRVIVLSLAFAVLAACASKSAPPHSLFDLGPARAAPAANPQTGNLPALSIAEVNAPAWLDSQFMYFRLAYSNEQQPRPYATSRWTMPPAQLFGQRLKSRLAQGGSAVLAASDGALNVPLMRIDADEFIQNFDTPGSSSAQIAIRASVFNGRTLVAQKSFLQQASAPSADAAGGAKAFSVASDALISDMMTWLASLPLKKN